MFKLKFILVLEHFNLNLIFDFRLISFHVNYNSHIFLINTVYTQELYDFS